MKNLKNALLIFAVLLTSCTDKKLSVLTPAQRKAQLDSVLKMQQTEIKQMEDERLRDRLSIEVKEKVDSIMASRRKNIIVAKPITDDTTEILKDTLALPTPL